MKSRTTAGRELNRTMTEKRWVIFGPKHIRYLKKQAARAERRAAKNALLKDGE